MEAISKMQVEDFIQRQESKGKKILKTLVMMNLIFFIMVLLLSLLNGIFSNLFGVIIMIVLCVLIYFGGNIAKWIYIVINSLNIFALIYTLTAGNIVSKAKVLATFLNVVTILMLIISIVTSIVLIFSSSVKDFMYKQKDLY
jgi:preprotein translocase subunit SecG